MRTSVNKGILWLVYISIIKSWTQGLFYILTRWRILETHWLSNKAFMCQGQRPRLCVLKGWITMRTISCGGLFLSVRGSFFIQLRYLAGDTCPHTGIRTGPSDFH